MKDMSAELVKLAEVLGPYLRAQVDDVRPRPDLHADHDRRLSALEKDMARVIGLVEGAKQAIEGQAQIDKRMAELEASRREDRAAAEAKRETNASRNEWIRWAIPTAVTSLPVLAFILARLLPPG